MRVDLTQEQCTLLLADARDVIMVIPCTMQSGRPQVDQRRLETYSFASKEEKLSWSFELEPGLLQRLGKRVLLVMYIHRSDRLGKVYDTLEAMGVVGIKNGEVSTNTQYPYLRYRPWRGKEAIGSYFMLAFAIAFAFTLIGLIVPCMFFLMAIPAVHYNYRYVTLHSRRVTQEKMNCVSDLLDRYSREDVIAGFNHYFLGAGASMDNALL